MSKRKNHKRKIAWGLVIFVGLLFIFLADVLAEEIRKIIGQSAFLWITIGLLVILFAFGFWKRKKVIRLMKKLGVGQLGA